MKTRFIVYDTETTGIDTYHDQVIQFSALTGVSVDKFDADMDLHISLLPYIVPSPVALNVAGVRPEDLLSAGRMSEFEAAKRIHSLLSPCRDRSVMTYVVTYNGLSFDEKILRSTFFRNLLDPYVTSYTGVRRIDLYPLMQAISASEPSNISIPKREDGKVGLKLEEVASANGYPGFKAHNSLEDCKATWFVMNSIAERNPAAWRHAMFLSEKANVEDALKVDSHEDRPVVWVYQKFGEDEIIPCIPICRDPNNHRSILAVRLDRDLKDVLGLSRQDWVEAVHNKEEFRKMFVSIKSNNFPILFFDTDADFFPLRERAKGMKNIERNANLIRRRPDIDTSARSALEQYCKKRDGDIRGMLPSGSCSTSESALYDGFMGREDKAELQRFHSSGWDMRVNCCNFLDARLRDFASRLVLSYWEGLDPGSSERISDVIANNWARHNIGSKESALDFYRNAVGRPWKNTPFWRSASRAKSESLRLAKRGESDSFCHWIDEHYGSNNPLYGTSERNNKRGVRSSRKNRMADDRQMTLCL